MGWWPVAQSSSTKNVRIHLNFFIISLILLILFLIQSKIVAMSERMNELVTDWIDAYTTVTNVNGR